MTVFSDTFDKNTPLGSGDPSEADDRMREIKAAVQERENVDHYWPLTGTEVSHEDVGEHRKVTLRVGSAPSAVADKGLVYAKDVSGKAELFYRDEDGNEIQLTSGGILNSLNLTGVQTVAGVKTFSSIPKIPTAAPTVDAEVVGKKYVDDHAKDIYGTGISKSVNTNYTAATSGILVVQVSMTGWTSDQDRYATVCSDDSATPTTVVGKAGRKDSGTFVRGSFYATITVPIIKDKKYRVNITAGVSTAIVFYPTQ